MNIYKTTLLFSLIKTTRNNEIKLTNSIIKLCKLYATGENNRIEIRKSSLYRTNIFIEGSNNIVEFEEGCEYGFVNIYVLGSNSTVRIGRNSSNRGGMFISCGNQNDIIIGEDCLFAHDIDVFASDSHQILMDNKVINTAKSININNHVWIGAHSSIMKGVNIGEGAVIGCRTVVTSDIDDHTLNVGSPSRCVKNKIDWTIERTI